MNRLSNQTEHASTTCVLYCLKRPTTTVAIKVPTAMQVGAKRTGRPEVYNDEAHRRRTLQPVIATMHRGVEQAFEMQADKKTPV